MHSQDQATRPLDRHANQSEEESGIVWVSRAPALALMAQAQQAQGRKRGTSEARDG